MKLVLQCAMCGTHHPVGTIVCSTCRASGLAQLRLMFECQTCGRLDLAPMCVTCPPPAVSLDLDDGLIEAEVIDEPLALDVEDGVEEDEKLVVDLSEDEEELEVLVEESDPDLSELDSEFDLDLDDVFDSDSETEFDELDDDEDEEEEDEDEF